MLCEICKKRVEELCWYVREEAWCLKPLACWACWPCVKYDLQSVEEAIFSWDRDE